MLPGRSRSEQKSSYSCGNSLGEMRGRVLCEIGKVGDAAAFASTRMPISLSTRHRHQASHRRRAGRTLQMPS